MNVELPEWKPFHDSQNQIIKFVTYAEEPSLEIAPFIGSDGVLSESGAREIERDIILFAREIGRAGRLSAPWNEMTLQSKRVAIEMLSSRIRAFDGIVGPTGLRVIDPDRAQDSECELEIGIWKTGCPLVSFVAPYGLVGRVLQGAIDACMSRSRNDVNFKGVPKELERQGLALSIAMTVFPGKFFGKMDEWLMPGVSIEFNESGGAMHCETVCSVLNANKSETLHLYNLPVVVAQYAANKAGGKESWTRTGFCIGGRK